jgi:hypothetical protein
MLELIDVVELATCESITIRVDEAEVVDRKYSTYRSERRVIIVVITSLFCMALVGVLHTVEGNTDFSLDKLALLRLNRFGWLRCHSLGSFATEVSFVSRFHRSVVSN